MTDSIFSTYRTGENRVTASILAVLRSLAIHRTERLLGALLEQSEFQLVTFQNQPSKGAEGVPDAAITASCRLLVETKIKRNTVRKEQLEQHLKRLDEVGEKEKVLLVITPDEICPKVIEASSDRRLSWTSFSALDQAIDELLLDQTEVVSEREAFLLRELQGMLAQESLVGASNDIVVVPAREAWPEYQEYHAYVCQPNRVFQGVRRMAFYTAGAIQPLVPVILESHEEVVFERGGNAGVVGELVKTLLDAGKRDSGQAYKVVLLSPPDDPRTLKLSGPIANDLRAASGRTTAFTQNQRYVEESRLVKAKVTSDLVPQG